MPMYDARVEWKLTLANPSNAHPHLLRALHTDVAVLSASNSFIRGEFNKELRGNPRMGALRGLGIFFAPLRFLRSECRWNHDF